MKRIINGISYNTDTAVAVFEHWNEHELSDAGLGLYQTRHGAFFKVSYPHSAEDAAIFTPLVDEDAQAILELHANHLVERYFGSMPEAGAAERRLTIRLPSNLANRIENVAKSKGLSFNSYALRCFEKCVTSDGSPKEFSK